MLAAVLNYAANLTACPVCNSPERIVPGAVVKANVVSSAESVPGTAALEEERERFLCEFKTQSCADSAKLSPTAIAYCNREENHRATIEVATICQACYDQLRERLDVLQSVLQMDLKDAAEVIYDAVWSDPSDPGKSYENAAQAMLSELKKRSGIPPVFGPLQTLAH